MDEQTKPKRGRGRPKAILAPRAPLPSFPNRLDIQDAIVEWIGEGKTLRDFCRQPNTPSFRVVYDWLDSDKDFASRFARAREIGADAIAYEALEIIDTVPDRAVGADGSSRYDAAHVTWLRNRAEQRLKLLAKWNPKRYGDRQIIAGDADEPVKVEASFDVFGELLKALSTTRQDGN